MFPPLCPGWLCSRCRESDVDNLARRFACRWPEICHVELPSFVAFLLLVLHFCRVLFSSDDCLLGSLRKAYAVSTAF